MEESKTKSQTIEKATATPPRARRRMGTYQIVRLVLGVTFSAYLIWRFYVVLIGDPTYGSETWLRLAISGIILGSVYALIAIGYTLVYGILRMINFAHGEIFMIGAFGGYFVLEALKSIIVQRAAGPGKTLMEAHPLLATTLAFLIGMVVAAAAGYFLEKIAYRPLRRAPRLVPLIAAIGASIFLQNAAQLLFGAQRRSYTNPSFLDRGTGWTFVVNGKDVLLPYTGALTIALSLIILVILLMLVNRTRMGRAMRAVAENKSAAALMGIDVDRIISRTFVISGALAGAAGVMWGLHLGQVFFFVGFVVGIKAFTAAVLGGIGNLTGAMLGAMFLGLVEAFGPPVLGMNFQLKDVIAFGLLVLILVFRPTGILGEVLTEEKV